MSDRLLALMTLWAIAALYVDFRIAVLRIPVSMIYVVAIIVILVKAKRPLGAAALCLAGFCAVLTWWLCLKPSNQGDWQADTARTGSVEINGDRVTIHNLRNCDYRTETDYANCWSDRTVYLSQLRYADLFFTTWGPKYIGHPIVSFQFGDNDHIAFSIEARYKAGQTYSAILGFFRQYELTSRGDQDGLLLGRANDPNGIAHGCEVERRWPTGNDDFRLFRVAN